MTVFLKNRPVDKFKINLEYEALVPPLTSKEFAELKKSILEEGLHDPLVVNKKDEVLDGMHRMKILGELKILRADFIKKDFESVLDEKRFVISKNLHRRQLTTAQKSELGLKLLEIEKEKARERNEAKLPKKGEKGFHKIKDPIGGKYLPQIKDESETVKQPKDEEKKVIQETKGKAIDKAAEKAGISGETLRKAKKIKEKAKDNPKIKKKWDNALEGKTSVSKIYTEDIKEDKPVEKPEPIPEKLETETETKSELVGDIEKYNKIKAARDDPHPAINKHAKILVNWIDDGKIKTKEAYKRLMQTVESQKESKDVKKPEPTPEPEPVPEEKTVKESIEDKKERLMERSFNCADKDWPWQFDDHKLLIDVLKILEEKCK